ncbi:G protein-coupled glucose receptor regulating Gpa2-domain-containing protein [Xylariales sp. PMI_506]|nr:G protein-coupled glucose receptor regulating Gpa2-domain-containing protein [Xylariales sp. PMI_506]
MSGLTAVTDTLYPLPSYHRDGLIPVTVFGFLSFTATTTLFLYLTFKLVRWHLQPISSSNQSPHNNPADLTLDLAPGHFNQFKGETKSNQQDGQQISTPAPKRALNGFLLLVYNLFLAEMQQSMAFLLNSNWVATNGILVGTPGCWAQGWFISTGDLASSCFVSAIAVHTYITLIKGYRPPQWALYAVVGGLWFFVYAMAILGVLITNNGRAGGGLYVRAVAWCWVNIEYENLRLWLHYFWIFLSLALTSATYVLIFFALKRRNTALQTREDRYGGSTTREAQSTSTSVGSHPGFLVYPIIYVVCTAPLALGRIASMAGKNVSVAYFCVAGSMIACNGLFDVLLFSWTRSSILFATAPDIDDTGIDTFTFIRTPHTRLYGNMVWVQGNARSNEDDRTSSRGHRGWWRIGERNQKSRGPGDEWAGGPGNTSQESLRATVAHPEGIQMDTITSVRIEINPDHKRVAHSLSSLD